jgi:hypothetical protein
MTVYEWKITDLGNERHGYIWISEDVKDHFGSHYRIYLDPYDIDATVDDVFEDEPSKFFNLEITEEDALYHHILHLWKRLGSPVLNRKVAGYSAPWLSWSDAGVTAEERDRYLGRCDSEARFEKAAEFMEAE